MAITLRSASPDDRRPSGTAPHFPVAPFLRSSSAFDTVHRDVDDAGRTGVGAGAGAGAMGGATMPTPSLSQLAQPNLIVPPLNFNMVAGGVYRSGHPNAKNFGCLERLRLKSVMYLAADDYREEMYNWAKENRLKIFHHRLEGNKEPFTEMDEHVVAEALGQVLDTRNHPMLIHCNKGKHRVGCLVGCLRKIQGWSHTSIFDEYSRFAGTKVADQEFIEIFDVSLVKFDAKHKPDWL